MRSGRLAKLLRVITFVAVLVTAQTATLVHSDLDDAHPADDVCALCVGLASLGAGNVATPQGLEVVRRVERFEDVIVLGVSRRVEHRPARGPPPPS